jgi:glucan 1,3-beta-glucosidase
MAVEHTKWRGVNLGGWLVLERWITPSLFRGHDAQDETSLLLELGDSAREIIQSHHETFITDSDYRWIQEAGLNTIRIPVPHWVFGEKQPYKGSIEVLDNAIRTANTHGLGVVIDLHAALGSQNGWDHSGVVGPIEWHKNPINIAHTLDVIEQLAERYAFMDNLLGIELLNEPHWDIPLDVLKDFYKEGYERVRRHCGESVAVLFHDSFRPDAWQDFVSKNGFKNMIQDSHLYQCFSEDDKRMDMRGHLEKTRNQWGDMIDKTMDEHPLIIGEWSLALDNRSLHSTDSTERDLALKAYGAAQLDVFNRAKGWFFWTYRVESGPRGWDFRECIKRGWVYKAQWANGNPSD